MNGEQAPPKKRKWIPIVIGVLILCFVVAAGGIALMVWMVRQSMSITDMTEASAASEFDTVRAKFAGQQPLIRLVDGRPQYDEDRASKGTGQPGSLTTMHILAWDDDEGKLVSLAVPFWLLRLKSGPIRLSAYSGGWDDRGVSFRIEDLERHGPGLLMDVDEETEGRVLIWVD